MFDAVRGEGRQHSRFGLGAVISLAIHVLLVGAAVLLSVRAVTTDMSAPEVTFFSAPPPPPPPPAGGSTSPRAQKVRPKPVPKQPEAFVQPEKVPTTPPQEAEPAPAPEPQAAAVPGGVEGGVEGGTQGGVVGNPLGGSGNTAGAKMVPAFVFDRERISAPEPRFPQSFVDRNAGRTLRATYRICVRPDGRVANISVISSSGMDEPILEQIKANWLYKPQPVPVCTQRNFVFKFQ